MKPVRIIIAGGGTGGHLFPGIAIADEFSNRNKDNTVCFIGVGNRFERSVLSETKFSLECITAQGIKGTGLKNQFLSVAKIPKGVCQSAKILHKFKPDLVIGLGGYSSGPVALAAGLMGVKTVIQEQNLFAGITNRILSLFAHRVYVSFPGTKNLLNSKKILVTGNPVRKEILQAKVSNAQPGQRFTVVILGGSQGAHSINKAMINGLNYLQEKQRLFFIHQTGAADETIVKQAYEKAGIKCRVSSFFKDMGSLYTKADIIICRAGATTVAEITALGKPAIFIPFPFATDNHQVINAQILTNTGAAEMIIEDNLSGKILVEKIEKYAANPDISRQMAAKSREYGRPDAARCIVDDCYRLLGVNC